MPNRYVLVDRVRVPGARKHTNGSWCNTFSALHVKDNSLEDDGGDSVYVDCVRGELVSLYCA